MQICMKVVFFGTPRFAADVLAYLLAHGIDVAAVVTKPDRPYGRSGTPSPSAVKRLCLQRYPRVLILQPDKASTCSFAKKLHPLEVDLFVVVAYGEIISQELLDLPKCGCINLHASLLPKYRGAAPIQAALLDGAKYTGVTIIEMALKMDAGDILLQERVPIERELNFQELEARLCKIGCRLLLKAISQYESLIRMPQNHKEATYAKKIDSRMAKLDWNGSAEQIHNRVRAFSPCPGAWCNVELMGQQKRLKIYRSKACEGSGVPGKTLSFEACGWRVACREGALLILEVQLEGKKRLSFEDFYKGVSTPPEIES